MRSIQIVLALLAVSLAAACGSGHRASQPAGWVGRANGVCKRDDAKFLAASFDTPSMVEALRREARDLDNVGFFGYIPQAAADVDTAGRLLFRGGGVALGKARQALLDAHRVAAAKGVHCSFGSNLTSP